jgi:hypothetical protein
VTLKWLFATFCNKQLNPPFSIERAFFWAANCMESKKYIPCGYPSRMKTGFKAILNEKYNAKPFVMCTVCQKSWTAPNGSCPHINKIPANAAHIIMLPNFKYMLSNSILYLRKNMK